jgi:hypothetical protein
MTLADESSFPCNESIAIEIEGQDPRPLVYRASTLIDLDRMLSRVNRYQQITERVSTLHVRIVDALTRQT